MDRKKTILVAVFINAGLLAVLFIAALTTQEETLSSFEMSEAPLAKKELPLFSEPVDVSSLQIPVAATQTTPPLAPVEAPIPAPEPIVHKLPPLVPETPPLAAVAPLAKEPSFAEIVVKKGDSLDKIAKANDTTVEAIIKANHLPSSFLKVGQVLKLPKEKGALRPSLPSLPVLKGGGGSPEYYTVKVGDNPWTIAMKHHMKVEELLKLNQLNEEKARKLKPGDRLRIR